jgi:PAS domain S-box-containing protein
MVEDSALDAELAQREIRASLPNCMIQCVERFEEYQTILIELEPDLIITDYMLPAFTGLDVIHYAKQRHTAASIIVLTGSIDENTAVACMKAGADDYVLKNNLRKLGAALVRALGEKRLRQERQLAQEALRESQERLGLALTAAQMGVWEWNLQTDMVVWSAECYKIVGRQHFAGTLADFVQILHPEDKERVIGTARHAIDIGATFQAEFRILDDDGAIRWVCNNGRTKYSAIGEPLRLVGTVQDITARKTIAARQKKLEEQLMQAQKLESIGRLAGGVAHDFNNLLTVMTGYTSIIQSRLATEDPLQKTLTHISRAHERAAALTHQLLAFSRKQILAPTAINLSKLTHNLQQMLERLIGEDIRLQTSLQADLHLVVADVGQLEQVITNLVINARDAMPTGGQLTIETRNIEVDEPYLQHHPQMEIANGPAVLLKVCDTGHGMSDEIQAHIFEPFFTTKEAGKGTGLGLATVYGIIKQSGGEIFVQSTLAQGTCFQIILPAVQEATAPVEEAQTPTNIQGGCETILLVEDEEMVRTLAHTVLTEKGYTVLEVRHQDDIFSLLQQHPVDLLLTDVVMPNRSGPELAVLLQQQQPDLKVIFMSGYTNDTMVRHGLQTAQVEFLAKPFSPAMLAAKVRTVLDK